MANVWRMCLLYGNRTSFQQNGIIYIVTVRAALLSSVSPSVRDSMLFSLTPGYCKLESSFIGKIMKLGMFVTHRKTSEQSSIIIKCYSTIIPSHGQYRFIAYRQSTSCVGVSLVIELESLYEVLL